MVESGLKMLHEYYFENVTVQYDEYLKLACADERQTKELCCPLEFSSVVLKVRFPSPRPQHWRARLLVKNLRVIFFRRDQRQSQRLCQANPTGRAAFPNTRRGAQPMCNALQSLKGVAVNDSGPLASHSLLSIYIPAQVPLVLGLFIWGLVQMSFSGFSAMSFWRWGAGHFSPLLNITPLLAFPSPPLQISSGTFCSALPPHWENPLVSADPPDSQVVCPWVGENGNRGVSISSIFRLLLIP